MNVGILLPPLEYGGVFQYALSITESLIEHSRAFEYTVLHPNLNLNDHPTLAKVPTHNIGTIVGSPRQRLALFLNLLTGRTLLTAHDKHERSRLLDAGIELMILPFPSFLGLRNGIPYVVSIPDLMHWYYPRFPEFPFKERIMRDIIYGKSAQYSVLTVVDDKQGVHDVSLFLKIPKDKLKVIPYIPSSYIFRYRGMTSEAAERILNKYHLPPTFLFYPAQSWYHKNHARLIRALYFIKQRYGLRIPLVLVGFQEQRSQRIVQIARDAELTDQVLHLGYVSDIELVALYKRATALVYPSLFGPTNIPPLEAMILQTPVACSNLFSMPRLVGNAGILFDPFNADDMAEKIYRVWRDDTLRKELIWQGQERTKDLTLENHARLWEAVISEAFNRRASHSSQLFSSLSSSY